MLVFRVNIRVWLSLVLFLTTLVRAGHDWALPVFVLRGGRMQYTRARPVSTNIRSQSGPGLPSSTQ